jgi:hypothetical protein
VPALLGYHPSRSLVVLSLAGPCGNDLTALMRHDLVFATGDDPTTPMAEAIEQFAAYFAREGGNAAVALLIDEDARGHRGAHDRLAADLLHRLCDAGASLTGAYATLAITSGGRWWSLVGPPRRGRIADPQCSPVTAAQVYAGRQIRESRADLERLVAPDPALAAQVRALIDAAATSGDLGWSLGARHSNVHHQRALDRVARQIAQIDSAEQLLPVELAELGIALSGHIVRDALLGFAIGARAEAAEQLWLALARGLPTPERAEPAALLAFSAYLRGDGSLARIALDAAHASDTDHRLANLLDRALCVGLAPEHLRGLATVGYDRAVELGVRLPEPVVEAIRPA